MSEEKKILTIFHSWLASGSVSTTGRRSTCEEQKCGYILKKKHFQQNAAFQSSFVYESDRQKVVIKSLWAKDAGEEEEQEDRVKE